MTLITIMMIITIIIIIMIIVITKLKPSSNGIYPDLPFTAPVVCIWAKNEKKENINLFAFYT